MPDPAGRMTAFDVKKHGFSFPNTPWPGDILIDVPLLGRLNLGKTSYGLCGGMSYAALDTFSFSGQAPPDSSQPPSGSKLRSYIYNRQNDTFKADDAFMIRRFIAWTLLPIKTTLGVTGLHVRSDREFKRRIAPAIDAGKPVPLGILRARTADIAKLGKNNAVFINHQVVAIGYRLCQATPGMKKHWAVEIYDPNFPKEIHSLHYSDKGRNMTLHVRSNGSVVTSPDDPSKNAEGGMLRAFFMTPYKQKQPYWIP
jgi:hypothetical protein